MAFCGNCGTQYQDGTRFCPRCGAPSTAQPVQPPPVYVPPQQAPYGGYAPPPQAPYPQYAPPPYAGMQGHARMGGGKSKTTAILLGFFFGPLTWLYTFKRDKGKFFLALAIGLIYFGGIVITQSPVFLYAGYLSPIIWLWAFIGALMRNSDWYASY